MEPSNSNVQRLTADTRGPPNSAVVHWDHRPHLLRSAFGAAAVGGRCWLGRVHGSGNNWACVKAICPSIQSCKRIYGREFAWVILRAKASYQPFISQWQETHV
jgi:hypothetical protein